MENTIHRITPQYSSIGKFAAFTVTGAIAAFSLFVLMGKLIENDNLSVQPPSMTFTPELLAVQDDKPTIVKPTKMPPPPVLTAPPPPPRPIESEPNNDLISINDDIGFKITGPTLTLLNFDGPRDNSAMPIVRVQPKYPMTAARDGIEGWVSLRFSINPIGQVTNVAVIDSEPSRTFDKEAKKALKKWKYKPQIKDGKAISVHNQSIMLEFKLGQS